MYCILRGEDVEVHIKGGAAFNITLDCHILMLGNVTPQGPNTEGQWTARMVAIEFKEKLKDGQKDTTLQDRVMLPLAFLTNEFFHGLRVSVDDEAAHGDNRPLESGVQSDV